MFQCDIIYCRVSTDEQTSNTSLPEQEQSCKEYLTRLGYTNFQVVREDYSGFSFASDRPELSKVLTLIKNGQVRTFTVLRVDRLCRKTGVLEEIRDGYFKPYGVKVFSLDLNEWQWNPMHETMQEQYALFASNWGKMAVQSMQNGRKSHVKSGNVITAAKPPLGLKEVLETDHRGKRIGAHFEFDDNEASIVIRIFENCVNDRMSLASIAQSLNSDEIPTYSDIRKWTPFKAKNSVWRSSTVRQILRNTVYDGRWYFGKMKTVTVNENGKLRKKREKTQDNLILVEVPALIPHDMFQEAQRILDENKKEKTGRKVSHNYLMSKRLKHHCGKGMRVVTKEAGKYQYYRCSTSNGVAYEEPCSKHTNYRQELIDGITWEWTKKIASDYETLEHKVTDFFEERKQRLAPIDARLKSLEASRDKYQAKYDKLIDWYLDTDSAGKELLESKKQSLEKALQEVKADILALSGQRMFVDYPYDETIIQEWLQQKKAKNQPKDLDNLSFQEQLEYVEKFNVLGEIVLKNGVEYLRLTCNYSDEELIELSRNCTVDNHITPRSNKVTPYFKF